ncbi:C2 family cysteine protease [Brachybacterium alimentarium]|uniref:C2 family cysteine protease n=1 Tax=Brachybacterium alimentarium TaxID=47845 RepID=UPI003FD62B0C
MTAVAERIGRRPRVRTWRRTLRALVPSGRARDVFPDAVDDTVLADGTVLADSVAGAGTDAGGFDGSWAAQGVLQISAAPAGSGWVMDDGPLQTTGSRRPQQGRLGDCWVIAAMLAIHETAPERLGALLTELPGGVVEVALPALAEPIRVDRQMPVTERGRPVYARLEGTNPGWAGVLEKALAAHVAGGYDVLARGFARFGLELLLGMRVRTMLRLPDARQIVRWREEGRAIAASTHPLSRRVTTAHGPLPSSHVFAAVGGDPVTGHVHLRNPTRPSRLLTIDARTFRRGFLSVDVTPPLR